MAVVHPSRMNLVPNAGNIPPLSRNSYRKRSPTRSRSRHRGRDSAKRRSPEYSDYQKKEREHEHSKDAPGPSMYPPRGRDGGGRSYYEDRGKHNGSDYYESRRLQREASTFSIWPPSPKAPRRDFSPSSGRISRRRRRSRSTSASSSSESERDRTRRKKKEEEERKRRHHRSASVLSEEDSDHHSRKRRRKDKERHKPSRKDRARSGERQKRRSSTRESLRRRSASVHSADWIEKDAPTTFVADVSSTSKPLHTPSSDTVPTTAPTTTTWKPDPAEPPGSSSDEEVGPQPLDKPGISQKVNERQYGTALLRGEGSAMAAFLSEDAHARIPRRGEIGLTPDEIANYEVSSYVMSGSRHRRMNAVRIRKENQVISAEEKREILKLQKEERERREAILREEFKELVQDKLKNADPKPALPL